MKHPKDKAEEIIEQFYQIFVNDEDEHYTGMVKRMSRQFALIHIKEVLDLEDFPIEGREYYEQVKEYIQCVEN